MVGTSEARAADYLMTSSCLPTSVKAAMALSRWARVWPALICTRMRAAPLGTLGS